MTINLTSVEHAVSLLSDRTLTDGVADDLLRSLTTATALIAAHLQTTFTSTSETKVYDIAPGFSDTPGAFSTPFTEPYRPAFSLPVTGAVNNLVVKYRGATTLDDEFSWSAIEPLVEFTDYIYDSASGEVRLRFAPTAMVHGLQVSYTQGYQTTPETLYGTARTQHLHQIGIDTQLTPLPALFMGIPYKEVASAAKLSATQPTLDKVVIAPPQAIAMHKLRLYAPQDAPMLGGDQPLTITVRGGPDGSATQISTTTVETPLEGQSYTLVGDPSTAYARYEVEFSGTSDAQLAVSLIDPVFVNPDVQHMRGSAPEPLTQACAMLAVHLYRKEASGSVGSDEDGRDRTYNSPVMPIEVSRLLRPYRKPRVAFV